jgi:hypothetical protein
MNLIGIEEGDKVVLESSTNSTTVRALEATPRMIERKQNYTADNPDRYPDCDDLLLPSNPGRDESNEIQSDGRELRHAVPVDIPPIFIDFDTRAELGLTSAPQEGVCQPIRVYRHNRSVAIDLLDDLTLPVLALFVSLILLIGNALSITTRLLIVIVGIALIVILIVLQGVYRARRNI